MKTADSIEQQEERRAARENGDGEQAHKGGLAQWCKIADYTADMPILFFFAAFRLTTVATVFFPWVGSCPTIWQASSR